MISAGWFTCAGWPNAFRIVQTCGIDVESTANGHVQPAVVQTQMVELPEPGERQQDGGHAERAFQRP